MKIKDIFLKNMKPNWELIGDLDEFKKAKTIINLPMLYGGNLFSYIKSKTSLMYDYLDKIALYPKDGERYLSLMASIIFSEIGYINNTKNLENESRNIFRKLFYDEDLILREKVCYIIQNQKFNISGDNITKSVMKLSYGLVNVEDMMIFYNIQIIDTDTLCYRAIDKEFINKVCELAKIISCYNDKFYFDSSLQKSTFFYNTTIDINKEKDFNVYIMIGIPGSGKSTWVNNNLHKDIEIISRDIIRNEIGLKGEKTVGDKSQERTVTNIFNQKLINCCEKRIDCVIDNTSVKKKYRDSFHKILLPYNPNIIYVYVESPSIEENKRRRVKQMDGSVIDNMLYNLEFPEPYEYDKIIYYKQV